MKREYQEILDTLGPDALELYQLLESLADKQGLVKATPRELTEILNRRRVQSKGGR